MKEGDKPMNGQGQEMLRSIMCDLYEEYKKASGAEQKIAIAGMILEVNTKIETKQTIIDYMQRAYPESEPEKEG